MPEPTLSQRARELLAKEMGLEVSSDTDIALDDKDECFVEDALRAIESALSSPIGEGVRDEVIEECARQVDQVREDRDAFERRMAGWDDPSVPELKRRSWHNPAATELKNAAQRIRTLKSRSLTPGHMGEAP